MVRDMIERLVGGYENGAVSRRELILALAALAAGGRSTAAQPTQARMPVQGLNHVTLFVSDVDRSVEFYQRLFEMPVQSRQQGGINLSAGSGTEFLGIFRAGEAPRIDHFCLGVQDFDVDSVLSTLRENGVEGRVRMREDVIPEIYFADPDGISVQVQDVSYCGGSGQLGSEC